MDIAFSGDTPFIWQDEGARCVIEADADGSEIKISTDTQELEEYTEYAAISVNFAEAVSTPDAASIVFQYTYEGSDSIYLSLSLLNVDGNSASLSKGYMYACMTDGKVILCEDSNGMMELKPNTSGQIAILLDCMDDYSADNVFYGMNLSQSVLRGEKAKLTISELKFQTDVIKNFENYKDVSFEGKNLLRIPSVGEEFYQFSIQGIPISSYSFEMLDDIPGCEFSGEGILSVDESAEAGIITVSAITKDGYELVKDVTLMPKSYESGFLLNYGTEGQVSYPLEFLAANHAAGMIHIGLAAAAALAILTTFVIYIKKGRKRR